MSQTPVSAPPPTLDLKDIQGDVILSIPKRVQEFFFFTIEDMASFRRVVGSLEFIELVTSTFAIQEFRKKINDERARNPGKRIPLIALSAVNIAFTQTGLTLVGLTDDIADPAFKAGQLAHANSLGDSGTVVDGSFDPAWLPPFKGKIDGLLFIAGDTELSVNAAAEKVLALLGQSIKVVFKVPGRVRPGAQKGHEHFGYLDGISSPAVKGLVTPFPGQQVIDPGVLLMGQPGDTLAAQRPAWTKNGSLLVYRHLDQLVPEFDEFKIQNHLLPLELSTEEGAELLGARLFGRWKSGAPTDLAPVKDDPALARDPQRNNNFDFSNPTDQTNCPFAAHIRKTNPRSDLGTSNVAPHAIHRTSIAFGPEVTDAERAAHKTHCERGLAFVCYQSNIANGFEFLQETWANNPKFIFGKTVDGKPFNPGFDAIIGQSNTLPTRQMGGFDPSAQANNLTLPMEFVVSKGGAYFLTPSISTLRTRIGTPGK